MTVEALHHALHDTGDGLMLRPLPADVAALLTRLQAPPRLAAHLRAVHDVAAQLIDQLGQRFPALAVDASTVLFGAATHDIGKVVHPEELTGPGSHHEPAGHRLLLAHGVVERLARFAATHASWSQDASSSSSSTGSQHVRPLRACLCTARQALCVPGQARAGSDVSTLV